ncbi:transglutaminase family protein [Phormidium sp. CLA17]|nr:transglutaminase family protein [Leptolyngbya sp. Cla-17]
MQDYLEADEVIDWHHPDILAQAKQLSFGQITSAAIAQRCFEWVRDNIFHSVDYQMNPVTCKASEVLRYETGYCYAKSHLLAALLRANGIPAGFCYQRLSIDDKGAPYSLHGFNAIYLEDIGWYRVDARGNREGVNAQFTPPIEQLAFTIQFSEEADFSTIFPKPSVGVVEALQAHSIWSEMLCNLPDISLEAAAKEGFFQ